MYESVIRASEKRGSRVRRIKASKGRGSEGMWKDRKWEK